MQRLKKRFYSTFKLDEFRRRRTEFLALDLSDPTIDVVGAAKHVAHPDPAIDRLLPFSWNAWYAGEVNFWRARAISRNKGIAGYYEEDLWEPPPRLVREGRFNRAGEPLFYAAVDNPGLALREARVRDVDQGFVLTKFALTASQLRLIRVGPPNPDSTLTWREQVIEAELCKFLEDAIRSPAEDRGVSTYNFTHDLLREFYELSDPSMDGWLYQSAQVDGEWNIALPAETAHSSLKVRGMIVGRVEGMDGPKITEVAFRDWADYTCILDSGEVRFPTENVDPAQNPIYLLPD
jgi:RES domain